jgi:hypothetical protein
VNRGQKRRVKEEQFKVVKREFVALHDDGHVRRSYKGRRFDLRSKASIASLYEKAGA